MRRSEINRAIAIAKNFFAAHQFLLPRFAFLSPDELGAKLTPQSQIYKGRLGWDVTDFGSGNFAESGIVLFTIRNGDRELLSTGRGRLYCEKVLLFQKGQGCPSHSHYTKTEDLINRGGGTLTIRLTSADLSGRAAPERRTRARRRRAGHLRGADDHRAWTGPEYRARTRHVSCAGGV